MTFWSYQNHGWLYGLGDSKNTIFGNKSLNLSHVFLYFLLIFKGEAFL